MKLQKMPSNVLVYINFYNKIALQHAVTAIDYLLCKNITCFVDNANIKGNEHNLGQQLKVISDTDKSNLDAILTFGGDGTILDVAKKYVDYDIPIMGFNVGKLGFLAEFSTRNLQKHLDAILAGQYKIIERFVLACHVAPIEDDTYYFQFMEQKARPKGELKRCMPTRHLAVNDFVISGNNQSQSRLVTISAYSNRQYIGDYRADGMIVSTPTGSTAYSMSCGGPIIEPDASVVCITPISPHTLTLRPVVVPQNKTISLILSKHNVSTEVCLYADGHKITTINHSKIININKFHKTIKIIVPSNSNYFGVLRSKLLWASSNVDDNVW